MAIKAQKGTKDILPAENVDWQKILDSAREVFKAANFKQIVTPIFEATELFQRGVGDSTDIVNKEMYSFEKSLLGNDICVPRNSLYIMRVFSMPISSAMSLYTPLRPSRSFFNISTSDTSGNK